MSEAAKTAVVTFEVHGMHCDGCVRAIGTALAERDGVIDRQVSLAESAAVVTYDPSKIAPSDMVAIIEDLGYEAREKR